jgi:hypothetical protein
MEGTVHFLEGRTEKGEACFRQALEKDHPGHRLFLERFPRLSAIPEVNRLIHKSKP